MKNWQTKLTTAYVNQINSFQLESRLAQVVNIATVAARTAAQDKAMEDAETLPINTSVATLVKKKVAKALSKLKLDTASKSTITSTGKSGTRQDKRNKKRQKKADPPMKKQQHRQQNELDNN